MTPVRLWGYPIWLGDKFEMKKMECDFGRNSYRPGWTVHRLVNTMRGNRRAYFNAWRLWGVLASRAGAYASCVRLFLSRRCPCGCRIAQDH